MSETNFEWIAKKETINEFLLLLLWPFLFIMVAIGIELIIFNIYQTQYSGINIFQNIFGTISFKDSELPKWAFIFNTCIGIVLNVFLLGIALTFILEWKKRHSK